MKNCNNDVQIETIGGLVKQHNLNQLFSKEVCQFK